MANVINRLRAWSKDILAVDADPSSGSGVKAGVDSLAFDLNSLMYQKTGILDTDWTQIGITPPTPIAPGAKTIFCIDNGQFASLQDAVDSASSGDTILLGVKAGGWGSVIFPAEKRLNIFGLAPAQNIDVQVDGIDFSPASGTNPNINQVFLQNLFITKPGGVALTFGGSVAARLRLNGCYIYQESNPLNECAVLTNAEAGSSCYFYNCILTNDNASLPVMTVVGGYTRIYDTFVQRGSKALEHVEGIVETVNAQFFFDGLTEVITVGATATLLASLTRFENNTANGSGINILAGGVMSNINNLFNIAAGLGYCVFGGGTIFNSFVGTTSSAVLPRNRDVQSPGITQVAYITGGFNPKP